MATVKYKKTFRISDEYVESNSLPAFPGNPKDISI